MKKILKMILIVFVVSFVFIDSSFAAREPMHPFDVYSGSFGPEVFGVRLGEKFDMKAISDNLLDQIEAHKDGSVTVKLVYDFYIPNNEGHVKVIVSRYSFNKENDIVMLEKARTDFSKAKNLDSEFMSSWENFSDITDEVLILTMKSKGYSDYSKAVSLKRREDDKTKIGIMTNNTDRIDLIRLNSDEKDFSSGKSISYESIVKQALKMFNLEGSEKMVDDWGNEFYADNKIGYKVKFYKYEKGEVDTCLMLAPVI